jgi:hypothetical protein
MRRSIIFSIFVVALLVLLVAEPAWAQCAMCKQTLENSEDAQVTAKSFNTAIAVLFFPPVAIFIGIFALIYRYRNKQGGVDGDSRHSGLDDPRV